MVDISFPVKGWDTNSPQNAKPEGTSPSLLNVVPFDRDQILRGAVRAGVSKFSPTQLGTGAQPVLLVQQVVSAIDPATIEPSSVILNEAFTYANNTTVASIDAHPVDSSADWRVSPGSNSSFPRLEETSTTALKILGNTVISSGDAVTPGIAYAVFQPTLTLGTSYVIECDAFIQAHIGQSYQALLIRVNKSTYSSTGPFEFRVRQNDCNLIRGVGNTEATLTFGTPLTVGFHQLQIRVNGNTITCWIDGIQYLTATNSTNSSQVGVGFGVGSDYTASGHGIKNFKVYTGAPLTSFRDTEVVAVCGGNIYAGNATQFLATSGGTAALSETIKPQMAQFSGICYFVDSVNSLKKLTMSTKVVTNITVSAGTETAATLGAYTLACAWHGRLVLAASVAFPMNFVMARQNDPTDWDYSQTDAAAAVAGNASDAGAIGDPLNALIPWTDDVLVLGGDHTIYKVEGDIAAGGQILNVSDSVGTLGADCWDLDPAGNLYFAGTGGVYKLASGGGSLENIASESVRKFFTDINRVTHYVVLTWDRDKNGLHIHVTPANTGAATHLFWDASTRGFFPIQFPNSFGPLTAIVFDGDGPDDRQLLLACRDGYVRKIDPTTKTDDGTDITSYVYIGPFRPAGDAALSVLEAVEIILGDPPDGFTQNDFGIKISTLVGTDGYRALAFPDRTVSFTVDQLVARRKRRLQRISGGTFFFKLEGIPGRLWSFEKLVALFTEGGVQRRWASVQD